MTMPRASGLGPTAAPSAAGQRPRSRRPPLQPAASALPACCRARGPRLALSAKSSSLPPAPPLRRQALSARPGATSKPTFSPAASSEPPAGPSAPVAGALRKIGAISKPAFSSATSTRSPESLSMPAPPQAAAASLGSLRAPNKERQGDHRSSIALRDAEVVNSQDARVERLIARRKPLAGLAVAQRYEPGSDSDAPQTACLKRVWRLEAEAEVSQHLQHEGEACSLAPLRVAGEAAVRSLPWWRRWSGGRRGIGLLGRVPKHGGMDCCLDNEDDGSTWLVRRIGWRPGRLGETRYPFADWNDAGWGLVRAGNA